jgi:hypothetical protein
MIFIIIFLTSEINNISLDNRKLHKFIIIYFKLEIKSIVESKIFD